MAIIAQLVQLPPQTENKDGEFNIAPPQAKFKVLEVLRGRMRLATSRKSRPRSSTISRVGGEYLILGAQPPAMMWSPPSALTPRSRNTSPKSPSSPPAIPERLVTFKIIWKTKKTSLSRDSFDEFALAPYSDLQILKPNMQHDKLVERDPRSADHAEPPPAVSDDAGRLRHGRPTCRYWKSCCVPTIRNSRWASTPPWPVT